MTNAAVFERLTSEQRRAVETTRGPVCILAGAGSGKTTTVTRRIANQVASGAFEPSEILAVTFTDKAANELRARLARLGVTGVPARTFHAAALAQLHFFAPGRVGEILPSKALVLKPIASSLPVPFRFRPLADLATEIEWAKNRRLTPALYRRSLDGHEPPIPDDLMARVFRQYEERKAARGRIDFEDVLELAVRLFDEDETALARFRERYRAFTVDEYQDVNLLQQSLLERWLGERDDLCVVGDDYQAIYSFTGATPRYLLELPRRLPGTTVIRLEENHRSTPQLLALANRLVPGLGGSEKVLRATRPDGAEPAVEVFASREEETAAVVERIRRLHGEGIPYEEMAVLYRLNSRSEDYEEALSRAGIAFQVRGGAFLTRPAARRTRRLLERAPAAPAAAAVRQAVASQGFLAEPPDGLGDAETERQGDLARLLRLAEEFDDGGRTAEEFLRDLAARFGRESEASGVSLLTYHRAKGLEWEAVFLPRLEEGELPFKRSKTDEALAEERRLLYVGMTRAKRHLALSWDAGEKPSRFLAELGHAPVRKPAAAKQETTPGFEALRDWRRRRAQADGVAAYLVFHDKVLHEIARRRPGTRGELAAVPGVGPAKLDSYADEVIAALADVA